MRNKTLIYLLAMNVSFLLHPQVQAEVVELIQSENNHYHLESNNFLSKTLAKKGHSLDLKILDKDINAFDLNSRIYHGNAPAAVRIENLDFQQWARLGFLANLNALATSEEWDRFLPKAVSDISKYNGNYISIPVSLRKTNVLKANTALYEKLQIPRLKTWEDFDKTAELIQQQGYNVIEPITDKVLLAQLFESIALSVGGLDYYKKVFIDLDIIELRSRTTELAFERYYKLLELMDFQVTEENQKTVFQIGGLTSIDNSQSKRKPSYETCLNIPGLEKHFIFDVENFVFFNMPNIFEKVVAQEDLAKIVISDLYQVALNRSNSSIPARMDSGMTNFSPCNQMTMNDLVAANNADQVIHSIANGIDTTQSIQTNLVNKIHQLSFAPKTPSVSARELSKALRLGNYILR
ncbi:hypothetical protein [Reinekea sp. G2M2-21]|uniref:hypothetical protein n=1 Tax=Reinekea sp. G2M2-21 TaxID=2788942 RepID=UPI0018A8B99C|nr:hypothetical protein [Reinekea sp. G2M2-21]